MTAQIAAFIVEGKCQTRTGRPVRIFTTEARDPGYPIVGEILRSSGDWFACTWRFDGSRNGAQPFESDLVPLPVEIPEKRAREFDAWVCSNGFDFMSSPHDGWEKVRLREVLPEPEGEVIVICPLCRGDGKDTCDNPDHGFIVAVGGEIGRLGCPVCGHDPKHKVKSGGSCDLCVGTGKMPLSKAEEYCTERDSTYEDTGLLTPPPAKALPEWRYFKTKVSGVLWRAREGSRAEWIRGAGWHEGSPSVTVRTLAASDECIETDEHGTAIHAENFKEVNR